MSFHPKMAYGATFHKSSRALEDEGPPFAYTPENRARFDVIVQRYPADRRRSAVLPALYLAQYQQGYITANAIRHVAELLGITRADVEDVVSYYTMFYTRPVGKFVINVCRTLSCAINGAERVTEELVGKLVVGVVNFPKKQIGPLMSECLVTGFYDANGDVVLCVPDKPVPLGAKLG